MILDAFQLDRKNSLVTGSRRGLGAAITVVVSLAIGVVPPSRAQQIKNVKIEISNPSSLPRKAADIVVPVSELKKVAPDFKPAEVIITASDAATLEEDQSALEAEELPSQMDNLDGDAKADELAFQIDLAPYRTRIVTISHGDQNRIWRLRDDYRPRTAALFSRKIEGLGWESERVAFRVYFDPTNASADNVPVPSSLWLNRLEETSVRQIGAGGCPQPYKPHPSRLRPASR